MLNLSEPGFIYFNVGSCCVQVGLESAILLHHPLNAEIRDLCPHSRSFFFKSLGHFKFCSARKYLPRVSAFTAVFS